MIHLAETTEQYRARINQLKTSIENEPYMKNMRPDIAEGISKTGNRQADIEDQFKDVIDGTTGKDVISAPEIIAARKGEASLNARLTKNEQETTAQLQQKADQSFVDAQLNALVGTSVNGTYSSLSALKAAYENGAPGVFLTLDNNHFYYWSDLVNDWLDGGLFVSGATKIEVKNEFNNGTFSVDSNSDGLADGLVKSGTVTPTRVEGTQTFIAGATFAGLAVAGSIGNGVDKYYVAATIKTNSNAVDLRIQESTTVVKKKMHTGSNNFIRLSVVGTPNPVLTDYTIRIVDTRKANWSAIDIKYLTIINLTEAFGSGLEPSVSTMDNMMSKFNYGYVGEGQTTLYSLSDLSKFYEKNPTVENSKTVFRINDDDPQFEYEGSWTAGTGLDTAKYYKGTRHLGSTAGDNFRLVFTGTGIQVIDNTSTNRGMIEVLIDGVSKGVFDRYAAVDASNQVAFSIDNLKQGEHILRVIIAKDKNGSALQDPRYFDFNYVEITQENNATAKVIDTKTGNGMDFWVGTQGEYDTLTEKNNATIYLIGE